MRFQKLHPNFGAEVRNSDPCGNLSVAQCNELRAALAKYQLLVFRTGHQISPERQFEVNNDWFGPPIPDNGQAHWSFLHSDEPAGAATLRFHCDFTYTQHPIRLISLQAISLPKSRTSTSFVSGVHAWETLTPALKEQLGELTARHVQDNSITLADLPKFIADQPIRYDHPRMGKPVLLVTEYHVRRINELSEVESRQLLHSLFDHLYRAENVYTHNWQLYDLLVWDNLALQHARQDAFDPENGARVMQRVALNDVPYEDLISEAWAIQRRGEGQALPN